MAKTIGPIVPQELGYSVIEAMVPETGRHGEIWVPGCLTTDDGNLEDESQY